MRNSYNIFSTKLRFFFMHRETIKIDLLLLYLNLFPDLPVIVEPDLLIRPQTSTELQIDKNTTI